MVGALVGYEMAFELAELNAANLAYAHGNIEGAIGHIRSMASLLNTELPPTPLPKLSFYDNLKTQSHYYFQCKRIVSAGINTTVTKVRVSYGRPFKVIRRGEESEALAVQRAFNKDDGKVHA